MLPLIGRTPVPPIQYPGQGTRVMPGPVMPGPIAPVNNPIGIDPGRVVRPVQPVRPIGPARPVLGQFHKGGMVPKTGSYLLKKGEHVLRKGSRKMTEKKPEMVSIAALRA